MKPSAFFHEPKHRADLAMLLVTIFWGLTFPVIRLAVQDLDPFVFVASRFTLAALVFAPFVLLRPEARAGLKETLLPGLLLGAMSWGSYVSQTMGLTMIGAGRAAFITGINCILVPLLAPLFRAGRPTRVELGAAVLATFGLFLLTDPRGEGIGLGDLLVLNCAFIYALYILVLQIVLRKKPNPMSLAFSQIVWVAVLGWIALPFGAKGPIQFTREVWVALLFCATLATIGTFWLQARFQGDTTPQRVALIFAMEPVFATLFAFLILGEWLPVMGQVGALVILVAVVGMELLDRPANVGS